MTQEKVREELEAEAEEEYKKFASSLLPGVDNMLGVRIPKLRRIAEKIAKQDWKECLSWEEVKYFEETMVQGMAIGYAVDSDIGERLAALEKFIPKIDNWSVNDSVCASFKFADGCREDVWDFLMEHKSGRSEFEARFVAVMIQSHYINDEYIDRALAALSSLYAEPYYASMGIAWAFASAMAAYPKKTKRHLKKSPPDAATYRRVLRKCLDSSRIDAGYKEYAKKELKRRQRGAG